MEKALKGEDAKKWEIAMQEEYDSLVINNTWSLVPVAPLLWPSVGVKPNTWKSRELESSGTPKCLELDSKGKNTSH
jgi:hypothetical protein